MHLDIDRFAFAASAFGQGHVNADSHLTNLKNMVSFKNGFLAGSNDLTIYPNDGSGVRRQNREPMDRPGLCLSRKVAMHFGV